MSNEAIKPPLPEPDSTYYAPFSGQTIQYHSEDQIYAFAAARVEHALRRTADPERAAHTALRERVAELEALGEPLKHLDDVLNILGQVRALASLGMLYGLTADDYCSRIVALIDAPSPVAPLPSPELGLPDNEHGMYRRWAVTENYGDQWPGWRARALFAAHSPVAPVPSDEPKPIYKHHDDGTVTFVNWDECMRHANSVGAVAPVPAGTITETDANDICQLPPDGWYCTRKAGHDGPCAAHQHEPDRELDADDRAAIAQGMARIKAGTPTPQPVASIGDDAEFLKLLSEVVNDPTAENEKSLIAYIDARTAAPAVADVKTMVNRFLCWPIPKTFSPDCGISFDGRKDDEWNKNKTWPIGTNLFNAVEAQAMFEHCAAAPQPPANPKETK